MIKIKRKIFFKCVLIASAFCLLFVFAADYWVKKETNSCLYSEVKDIPKNKVGLLLGTGKYLQNGRENYYYRYRIDAAVALFKSGKIKYILISGDNGSKNYDEPTSMKNDLMAKGVPEANIFLDYAGFCTLDSVIRSKEVFGLCSLTIISQEFHNRRALFIAKRKGLDAVGYNARDVGVRYGFRIQLREKLARVKMLVDLMLGIQPKFFGEKIQID